MKIILSTGSLAVFYSAWHLNLTMFSLEWFLYCIAWTPLLMLFIAAYKYDKTKINTHDLDKAETKNLQKPNKSKKTGITPIVRTSQFKPPQSRRQ